MPNLKLFMPLKNFLPQFSKTIKILHFNSAVWGGGGRFCGGWGGGCGGGGGGAAQPFQKNLQNKGIVTQRTCPYTPQQNGVGSQ